ncbi:cytochrome P450 [Salinispora pacifica]|uniref:cytochrome P450 n=1 Tax=Salinispora pacifica TaxID=351187 RepID=UPI0003780CFA|nr:cytochrome P450 [Salinispora pacifica]
MTARAGSAAEDIIQLADRMGREDPYPVLHRMRQASPYVALPGLVVAGTHATCSAVLRDPGMSSERQRATLAPAARGPRTRNFLHLDPPDHTRLRRLVSKVFTPRVVATMEPHIRRTTDDLLTAAAARGSMEVVADLAYPLPLRIICEVLGVPAEDHHLVQHWSARLSEALEPPIPGLVSTTTSTEAARARAGFIAYFQALIADRRRSPRADLVSQLVAVEDASERLDSSDILATCILLINAGHETTVNLIANGVLALLRHPEQLADLRAEPGLAAATVDEVLRYDAPVQITSRVAKHDTRLGAADVRAGDMVVLLLGAANRDPAVYPDPDRFDIRRRSPVPHLAFSAGAHFCLGAGLARLEAQIALSAVAARLREPRLRAGGVSYKPNLSLRGPDVLTVDFDDVLAPGRRDGQEANG